jgi:hypothetical protein
MLIVLGLYKDFAAALLSGKKQLYFLGMCAGVFIGNTGASMILKKSCGVL